MSKNHIAIPPELYVDSVPPGYECSLYVGRMAGQLGTTERLWKGQHYPAFTFEITDVDDPTIWLLKYHTFGASGEELARWENHGDVVGLVMASKANHIALVLAYNFTRGRWISSDDFPHKQDSRPWTRMDFYKFRKMMNLLLIPVILSSFCMAIVVLFPAWLFVMATAYKPFLTVNQSPFRRETARRIADWIAKNQGMLQGNADRAIDPSL